MSDRLTEWASDGRGEGWCPSPAYHVRGSGWNGLRYQLCLPVKTHEGMEVAASGNPGVPPLGWGVLLLAGGWIKGFLFLGGHWIREVCEWLSPGGIACEGFPWHSKHRVQQEFFNLLCHAGTSDYLTGTLCNRVSGRNWCQ